MLFLNLPYLLRLTVAHFLIPRVHCALFLPVNVSTCLPVTRNRPDVYYLGDATHNPYAVLLYCGVGEDMRSVCSATLVTAHWVLTARHCLQGCHYRYVYAGGNSLHELVSDGLASNSQLQTVDKICEHRLLDVALMRVRAPFTLTKYVNTATLPAGPLPEKVTSCNITGFGRVMMYEVFPNMDYRRKTQIIDVVCPCDCSYQEWKWSVDVEDAARANGSNFVCSVPKEEVGVCRGDSGSGLMCGGSLHGVTSLIFEKDDLEACILQGPFRPRAAGVVCGSRNTTSVFVSVHPLLPWLNRVTSGKFLTDECYDDAVTNHLTTTTLFGTILTLLIQINYLRL